MIRHWLVCRNPGCPAYKDVPTIKVDGTQCCLVCCATMEQRLYAPAVIWTDAPRAQRYRDRSAEGYHSKDEGMWAWERNGPDGKPLKEPRPVRLENWRDVHEYSKREHVYDPREIPKTIEVDGTGKSSNPGRGMPGQEI